MDKISRRKNIILISAIVAIIFATTFAYVEKYKNQVIKSDITFSNESGFYDEEFDLELSVGSDYFITYTLDESDPTIYSTRYEGPIHISDASENENVWCINRETSTWYYDKTQIYQVPTEKVDKCTVVRASAFDSNGEKVSSCFKEYFIGFDDKKGYDGLYTVCVVTEPPYLFDDNIGIYTLGAGMREFVDSGEVDEFDWREGRKKAHEANWDTMDGRSSERVTGLQIFDENHNLVLDTVCGLRVRGNNSRHKPQKSLGLYARREYRGDNRFDWDPFQTGKGPESFVVFGSADDSEVKIKDYIIHRAEKEANSNFTTSNFIPCNLFLQGEYWGPMYIMEDLNADFLSQTFNVNKDDVRLVKGNVLKASDEILLSSTDRDEWKELLEFIKSNDMSDEENYKYVCEQMDIDSYVDYVATELYIGNQNWKENNNSAAWRVTTPKKDNKYADGRWRFCLYDVNTTLIDYGDGGEAVFERILDYQKTVKRLAKNPDFENRFRKRVEELEEIYSVEKVQQYIDEWRVVMEEPVECYYKRFADKPWVENQTEEEIESILKFLGDRPSEMECLCEKLFK